MWSVLMGCPISRTSMAATSHRSGRSTRDRWRPRISTGARSRSTAAPTRSSGISSRRRSWGSEAMDFDLTEEQRLLQESVGKLIADEYDFEKRKIYAKEPAGFSEARWAQYAELGLLGLPFPERLGGSGGTPVETMIVMESFGRGLVLEPYLATVILGGGLLRLAGSPAQQQELVPAIAKGKLRLAFAYAERQSRYDLADVATSARQTGGGYVLNGEKGVVLHGDSADRLIVLARTAGGQREQAGLSLFLVDPRADGVQRRGYPTQDGQRAAEIAFREVRLSPDALLGSKDQAWPVVE